MPTTTLAAPGVGPVPVTYSDTGTGRAFLLLHGGAGPQSVAGFAGLLAGETASRVITPVHPGFEGTPRPDWLRSAASLAGVYALLLHALDLTDVTIIGNSIGGWIAAELTLTGSARITGVTLVDAVGIEVAGHPVADFFSLTLPQVAELSYHDPARFRIDPSTLTPERQAAMAGNRAALGAYTGAGMSDPALAGRLARIAVPALVVWGDSDRIVDPDYGRAYAAAIPGARFCLLGSTGHLPQLESPAELLAEIRAFAARPVAG